MPTEFVIRRERPDQPEVGTLLAALDAYLAGLYPPEANHILGLEALQGDDVRFFVGREGARAVAIGAVRLVPSLPGDGAYAEIKRMYVSPAARGRGYACAMIGRLEAAARDEGLDRALLETGRDQTEAVRLYERCGYVRCGAFGGYPDNGLSLFMGKRLAPAA